MEGIEGERHRGGRLFRGIQVAVAQVVLVLVEERQGGGCRSGVAVLLGVLVAGELGHRYLAGDHALLGADHAALRVAVHQVVDPGDEAVEVAVRQKRQDAGDLHFLVEGGEVVARLFGHVDDSHGDYGGLLLPDVEPFHGGELHGLAVGDMEGGFVPVEGDEDRGDQAEGRGHHHGALGHDLVPLLDQEESRDPHDEERGEQERRTGGVGELVHRIGGKGDLGEILHLEARLVRVEGHGRRGLHPGVGDQDPDRREVGADGDHPGGEEVKSLGGPLPAEEHDGEEGRLQEEGEDPFDRQGRAEDVTHHPGVVGPVGAELELHDDAGGDPDGEVDAEEGHPELGQLLPALVAGLDVDRLEESDQKGEPQSQRHENPVIHGGQGELRPGPVHRRQNISSHVSPLVCATVSTAETAG